MLDVKYSPDVTDMLPDTTALLAVILIASHYHLGCMGLVYYRDPSSEEDDEGGLLIGPVTSWVDFWLPSQPQHSSGEESLVYLLHQHHPQASAPQQRQRYRTQHGKSLHRHFGYSARDGPDVWPLEWPMCGGHYQSPINLESDYMYRLIVPNKLSWRGYWSPPRNMTLTNNGHTVEIHGYWGSPESTPTISEGPLDGVYQFSQLHFHWGTRNHIGSEHRVNNRSFPMEMHMVHYKREYGSQEEAAKHEDGLAVVAYLFQLSERPNPALNVIMPWMDEVLGVRQSIVLPHTFSLEMFDITFPTEYVTYFGSLTTPPCSEVVTWIVSSYALTISPAQLGRFRRLSAVDSDMENNFRPVQPLNGRSVFYVS